MSISPEDLAAFADDQLSGEAHARIAAAVAADPALAQQVAAHRALKAKLFGHFAPVIDQPIPARLADLLHGSPPADESTDRTADVVDLAERRNKQPSNRRFPGWAWGGAIAASLVAAIVVTSTGGDGPQNGYAPAQLASVLTERLVATQSPQDDMRILLSFRSKQGQLCRAFSGKTASGIACRDGSGWRLEALRDGTKAAPTEFRQAGSEAGLLTQAQDMAAGPALTADQERAAQAADWQN